MSGISAASLVDLKAELFRKQEEFKKQKILNASTNYIKGKTTEKFQKTSIFSRKNAGVSARSQKDLVAKTEEEDLHEKSRRTLEAKSKLYDQITQDAGIPDEDGSQLFLVDFQKKVIDKRREQKDKDAEKREEKDESEDEFVDSPNNPDEKWVEYTDSLGRTRTCMEKDLVTMHKRDKELGIFPVSQTKEETKDSSVGTSSKESVPLSSQEIYCQMLKDKWEKEEEEALAKPAGPVHYENVRFDEIRTHGVGYFQFSKHETERQEQMDLLNSLRDQTKDERTKRNELKEKRNNLMAARLKKIKDRQRAKMGLPPEPEIEEEPSPDPKIPDEENVLMEVKTEDVVKSPAPVREWDLGKDKFWESEKKYFKERREERESEFAPPSSYFSSNAALAPKRRTHQELQYSPPLQKKAAPKKLKKNKIKPQGKKGEDVKETPKIRNDQIVEDLSTIPLPGETPIETPIENYSKQEEKLTINNYTTEYQQPQPDAASSDNAAPLQMWSQPTATLYSAMHVDACSNQQQNLYPSNVATTMSYQYTQTSSPMVTQQTVEPEKPKPAILDRRFFKNVESLQSL